MLATRGPCNRNEDLTCVLQLGFESHIFRPIILAKQIDSSTTLVRICRHLQAFVGFCRLLLAFVSICWYLWAFLGICRHLYEEIVGICTSNGYVSTIDDQFVLDNGHFYPISDCFCAILAFFLRYFSYKCLQMPTNAYKCLQIPTNTNKCSQIPTNAY